MRTENVIDLGLVGTHYDNQKLDIGGIFAAQSLYFRLKHLNLPPQHKVLDIGSGDGSVVRFFRNRGINAYGIEIRKMFLNSGQGNFILGDVRKMPFADQSFDAVTESFVFPYLQCILKREVDVQDISWEIDRILKPGGCFIPYIIGDIVYLEELGYVEMFVKPDTNNYFWEKPRN